MGVAVIGADLTGFPAGERHIAAGPLVKNPLDMACGIEPLLPIYIENVHVLTPNGLVPRWRGTFGHMILAGSKNTIKSQDRRRQHPDQSRAGSTAIADRTSEQWENTGMKPKVSVIQPVPPEPALRPRSGERGECRPDQCFGVPADTIALARQKLVWAAKARLRSGSAKARAPPEPGWPKAFMFGPMSIQPGRFLKKPIAIR
jgi:hypothetical protein